jgi:hypothetical protein
MEHTVQVLMQRVMRRRVATALVVKGRGWLVGERCTDP